MTLSRLVWVLLAVVVALMILILSRQSDAYERRLAIGQVGPVLGNRPTQA
jgi:hypothetical protein